MVITQLELEKIIIFIEQTSNKFNIDKGHGLNHSMKILNYCTQIIPTFQLTSNQIYIIELSALLHDMCDKKYMNESEGIIYIEDFLKDELQLPKITIGDIETIILNISYSKVIKTGYPDFTYMKHLEIPYHITRNADLLCAYELERCIEYQKRTSSTRKDCLEKLFEIYSNRVSKLISNGFINLEPALAMAKKLEEKCITEIEIYQNEYRQLLNHV